MALLCSQTKVSDFTRVHTYPTDAPKLFPTGEVKLIYHHEKKGSKLSSGTHEPNPKLPSPTLHLCVRQNGRATRPKLSVLRLPAEQFRHQEAE